MKKDNLFALIICILSWTLLYFSNYSVFCLLVLPVYFILTANKWEANSNINKTFNFIIYLVLFSVILVIWWIYVLLMITY